MNQDQNLHQCAHCGGTGTCNHGKDGAACAACVKSHKLWKNIYYGLACGTCGGLGKTDTLTYRLNNRAAPLLAISIIFGCFGMLIFYGFLNNQHFSEMLAFCGTLSGAVVGHYFGRRIEK